jgi:hypothetical protein
VKVLEVNTKLFFKDMIPFLLKICFSVIATGVFTPNSIRKTAEALWEQIPKSVQEAYTKEYFDDLVNKMIYYSTCGVRYNYCLINLY